MATRTVLQKQRISLDCSIERMRKQPAELAPFLGKGRSTRLAQGGEPMGPTKVVVDGSGLYDAVSGKLIKDGFASRREIEDYANHHYMVLPVVDNAGRAWSLDGKPVYCLRGVQYETVNDERIHLSRCPDCGGMGIRCDEFTVESDCIRCTACGHEFDARLEMMET